MPDVTTQVSPTVPSSQNTAKGYTPPNWPNPYGMYLLVANNADGTTTMFVFDGLIHGDHDQSCIPTQHPLQEGYNIADHAVLQPARLTIEVVMNDSIAAYSSGMWSGNPSKSISAYQQMIKLMTDRTFLTISAKFRVYQNMLLVNVRSSDNAKNHIGGASMVLTFQQIFVATVAVSAQSDSARLETTGESQSGTVNGQTPDDTMLKQHTVTPSKTTNKINWEMLGGGSGNSGTISSNSIPYEPY